MFNKFTMFQDNSSTPARDSHIVNNIFNLSYLSDYKQHQFNKSGRSIDSSENTKMKILFQKIKSKKE